MLSQINRRWQEVTDQKALKGINTERVVLLQFILKQIHFEKSSKPLGPQCDEKELIKEYFINITVIFIMRTSEILPGFNVSRRCVHGCVCAQCVCVGRWVWVCGGG